MFGKMRVFSFQYTLYIECIVHNSAKRSLEVCDMHHEHQNIDASPSHETKKKKKTNSDRRQLHKERHLRLTVGCYIFTLYVKFDDFNWISFCTVVLRVYNCFFFFLFSLL